MSPQEPPIEAVLFDGVGTLFRVEPSVGGVYAAEAARFGVMVEPKGLDEAFRHVWKTRRVSAQHGRLETSEDAELAFWHGVVSDVFEMVGRRSNFGGQFDAFFDHVFELFATPAPWRMYADAMPALDALSASGIRCGIVSNWDSRLHRLIDAVRLRPRLEAATTSAECGYRKPHPRPFEAALEMLALPRERVAHVGDSEEEDVEGARAAGLMPILVRRRGVIPSEYACVASLTDVPRLLRERAAGEELG
jgi:putative hydrolase of the HAD superfamily